MSIKRYCDVCGTQIAVSVTSEDLALNEKDGEAHEARIVATISAIVLPPYQAQAEDYERGDLCKYCLLDAFVRKYDDRKGVARSVEEKPVVAHEVVPPIQGMQGPVFIGTKMHSGEPT